MKINEISAKKDFNAFSAAPFQIDSPSKPYYNRSFHGETIPERPEDDSMLLKASGFSLNTTNMMGNNPLLDDDLESILSLQPEKLDLKNLK